MEVVKGIVVDDEIIKTLIGAGIEFGYDQTAHELIFESAADKAKAMELIGEGK